MKSVIPHWPRGSARRAFSLLEVLVALMMISIGVTAVYVVGSQSLQLSVANYKSSQINAALQEQLERLRAANFNSLLSSGSLNSLITSNPLSTGSSMGNLSALTDTVTITPALAAGAAISGSSIKVRRAISNNGTQAVTTLSSGSLNSTTTTVQVDVSFGWADKSGTHSRLESTLISSYE